jgi:hypothetical protein
MTDPYYTTYGENSISNTEVQEVYLYDTDLGFVLTDKEPFVTNSNGSITIQDIEDPYPTHLQNIIDSYEEYQEEGKLIDLLHNNGKVQNIETQISQLKKNYLSIINNSTLSYTDYTSGITSPSQYLFLIIKGPANNKFDITFRDTTGKIIKREYNCTFNNQGLYISLPFSFDTFSNAHQRLSFDILRHNSPTDIIQFYEFR